MRRKKPSDASSAHQNLSEKHHFECRCVRGVQVKKYRSIDQPRSDRDSENRRSSRSPQHRPSFTYATPPQEVDRPIRTRSTSPLPPPPYIRQTASTLSPPTAPNHDNIGAMAKTCHYCDAKSQGLLSGTQLLITTLGRRVIQA